MIRHYLHFGSLALEGEPSRIRKDRRYDVTLCGTVVRPKILTPSENQNPKDGTLCVACRDTL